VGGGGGWGVKLQKPSMLVVNWISSCLSLFLNASIIATYIFTTFTCTTTIISLKHCALMLNFNISYWELVKCPYFVNTTKRNDRWWKEAQIQGENIITLWIIIMFPHFPPLFVLVSYGALVSFKKIWHYLNHFQICQIFEKITTQNIEN